jgi:hypothetical protein
MKPTELRIGNLVMYNGEVVKVEQITKHKIGYHTKPNETRMNYARLCEIEPIPITEEWLTKIGFVKRIYSDKIFAHGEGMLSTVYFIESTMIDIRTEDNDATILCKHLHQLQNAYYLVVGKELIKL